MLTLRAAIAGLTVAALGLAPAAGAHGKRTEPGYVSTVAGIEPSVLGLTAVVLEGDDILSVRNWSGKTVVILDAQNQALLRFSREGVFRRGADGWRLVKRGTSYSWHDPRIHWGSSEPPAVVSAEPGRQHRILDWRIPGTAAGRRFAIQGYLGYAPPAEAAAEDDSVWRSPYVVAGAVALGLLLLAALLLPSRLRR